MHVSVCVVGWGGGGWGMGVSKGVKSNTTVVCLSVIGWLIIN